MFRRVLFRSGGVPAKVIRKRYADNVIFELLNIKWWDWDKQKIARNIKAIECSDIALLKQEEFL